MISYVGKLCVKRDLIIVGFILIHVIIFHPFIVTHILTLWPVCAYTSDNGLFNLAPFATDVRWLVVIARACGCVSWVGHHFEYFAVLLVGPVRACECKEQLSLIDLRFGPVEKLVGYIVFVSDVFTLFLLVTQTIGIPD